MNFAHPLALLLLFLLIPIGLLYWLRLHVPRVVVATGPLWQKALAEEPLRACWQRWRTPVSLLLQVLTVVLLSLAAAGPEMQPPQRIVLILDNSATMRATDVQPSRFDAAKEVARRMIDSLRWRDRMAVVVTNAEQLLLYPNAKLLHLAGESQPLTTDRTLLRAAVDSAQPVAEPPLIRGAVKVAREIGPWDRAPVPIGPNSAVILTPGMHPADPAPPRIVLITDGCATDAAREAQESGVEVLCVGTAAGNRAITCFTARRSKIDPAKCEVFVEVRNHGDQTAQGRLELSADDKLGPAVPFVIEKDGRWQHLFDGLSLSDATRLTATITPADAYSFDDTASLFVPAPLRVGARSAKGSPAGMQRPWNDPIVHPLLPRTADEQAATAGEGGLAALYRGILLAESHLVGRNSPMLYAEFLGPLYGEPNGVDIRVRGDAAVFPSVPPPSPLWISLAAAAALLIVLEWCLWQRRWTS